MATIYRHPECGEVWTGLRRQHCPSCHLTFNSTSAGDMHRVGRHGIDRRCVNPMSVGLIAKEMDGYSVWMMPREGQDD